MPRPRGARFVQGLAVLGGGGAGAGDGWSRGRPDDEVSLAPLADGGEGTLDAIAAAGGWASLPAAAARPAHAAHRRAASCAQGERAVVELAVASGLSRVAAGRARRRWRRPRSAPGRSLAAAIGLGCTDDRAGPGRQRHHRRWRRAADAPRRSVPRRGRRGAAAGRRGARGPRRGRPVRLSRSCGEVRLTVASDVTNPLLGRAAARPRPTGPRRALDHGRCARLDAAPGALRGLSWRRPSAGRCATCPARARRVARPSACWPSPTGSRRSRSGRASTWSWS